MTLKVSTLLCTNMLNWKTEFGRNMPNPKNLA